MTYRPSDTSPKDRYSRPQSRLNQQIRSESTDEGCPVIEESGTVCGEEDSLCIFEEFRQIYNDCLKKLEASNDGNTTLARLAPFKNLIENLWKQNALLVETVQELEHEATCTVTNLQEKLNKSCQKMCQYQEDINSLIIVIRRFSECGVLDYSGLRFYTISPSSIYAECESSAPTSDYSDIDDLNMDYFKKPKSAKQNKKSRKEFSSAKNKATPGVLCKNNTNKQMSPNSNTRKSSSSRQKIVSTLREIESEPDLVQDPICHGYYHNENRPGNCDDIFDQSAQLEQVPCYGNDCQDCVRPININLNIGGGALLDAASSHHYNCSCPGHSSGSEN